MAHGGITELSSVEAAVPPQPSEKIAIVVIHGVGETEAGWIDTYLVPQLEKWSAFDRVGGLARKDCKPAVSKNRDQEAELVITARASGGDWIAVALGNDEDFASFATVIGRPELCEDATLKSRAGRCENRDDLVRLVSGEICTASSHEWLSRLKRGFVPSTPAFQPESEVHRVRDPEASDPTATWKSFTRRWPLPGREVMVTEMFWADLSHGEGTILTRILSLIELFLEAPFVLGRAFLEGAAGRFENAARKLILAANWIMRWPIAGLNAAVFSACFAAMALAQFKRLDLLPAVVVLTLLSVAFVGLVAASQLQHRRPGLADIGLASFVAALALALAVAVAWALGDPQAMQYPPTYLAIAIRIILFFWFLWTLFNVTAVMLVCLVAVKRGLQGLISRSLQRAASRDAQPVPLYRPAAAIGLGVLIGIFWKLVLAILGILVIANLGMGEGSSLVGCRRELSLLEIVMGAADVCQMIYAKQQLINVRDLNIAALVGVLLSVFLVVRWRQTRCRTYPVAAGDGTLSLPRLIAHPLIIATLFVVAVVNGAIFYVLPLVLGAEVPLRFRDFIFGGGGNASLPPAIGFVLFAAWLIYLAEHSSSNVHIGRDLVDHQYYRDPAWGSVKLQAKLSRALYGITRGKWGLRAEPPPAPVAVPANLETASGERLPASQNPAAHNFPRRLRIQRRLEALIDDVIRANAVDRLIFLAHSQGTVILSDYLNDHNGLVHASHEAHESLEGVKRIDVLTFGSPLKHIYEYYYGDYEPPYGGSKILDVDSWTNMWRVDDPIGQDINPTGCSKDGVICNIGIGPGGHEDYWKENDVLAALWSLIENRPLQSMPEILGLGRMPERT